MQPDWKVPKIKLLKYDDVAEQVAQFEDLRIVPDKVEPRGRGIVKDDDPGWDVVNLKKMRFTSSGAVQVPGFGLLGMTDWARKQLGTELGVNWDKFFGNMPADQINRAVSDHLRTRPSNSIKKVVASRFPKDEQSVATDGNLRGLVSPTYSEIADSRLLARIQNVLGVTQLRDMSFLKHGRTDRGTYFVLVFNEQINLLSNNDAKKVVGEEAFYGLRLRNSDVGAFSLTGDGYFVRVVCTNGMIVAATGDRWLKRRHRYIDDDNLDQLIDDMTCELTDSKDQLIATNKRLESIALPDPKDHLVKFLARYHQPKVVQEAAVVAYEKEPLPTAYGALQAISRLGSALRGDSERQFDIEDLTRTYVTQTIKEAA